PCLRERICELLKTAARDIGEQRVAVAVVAVRGSGAHAPPARCVGGGKTPGALLRGLFQRGPPQSFFEIAVVIATRFGAPAPFHVNGINMSPSRPSMRASQAVSDALRKEADCRTASGRSAAHPQWSGDAVC